MSTLRPTSAKIIQHAEGLGAPCTDEVRRRAQELALIAGRAEFTETDWQQAKRELHGGHESSALEDEAEMARVVFGHDMVMADIGHHVENIPQEDAGNIVEELIAEGMDEAVHEQMIEARREQSDESEEEEA